MPPEKIDSLADDVKPLVLGLLRQISGLTARVEELLAQNQALLEGDLYRHRKTASAIGGRLRHHGRSCSVRFSLRRSRLP
jgi:hypothetical protein